MRKPTAKKPLKRQRRQRSLKQGDFAIYIGHDSWKYGCKLFLQGKNHNGSFDCWFFMGQQSWSCHPRKDLKPLNKPQLDEVKSYIESEFESISILHNALNKESNGKSKG